MPQPQHFTGVLLVGGQMGPLHVHAHLEGNDLPALTVGTGHTIRSIDTDVTTLLTPLIEASDSLVGQAEDAGTITIDQADALIDAHLEALAQLHRIRGGLIAQDPTVRLIMLDQAADAARLGGGEAVSA